MPHYLAINVSYLRSLLPLLFILTVEFNVTVSRKYNQGNMIKKGLFLVPIMINSSFRQLRNVSGFVHKPGIQMAHCLLRLDIHRYHIPKQLFRLS